jgi:ubiquinone/menaquinone biosynthesis C-methylase UbiE
MVLEQQDDHSFKWFAEQGFFKAVNAHLVDLANIHPGQRIVELACGTGAATRLIRDRLEGARESLVIGIDASASALREAMQQLGNARDVALQFIQGRVEALSSTVREHVDGVIFCNGIHYVSDKDSLLDQISQTLKVGGTFAFNTSFYQGAHLPETEGFYRRWMFKAIRLLRSEYQLRPQPDKVESRRQLTPEQYSQLLRDRGFTIQCQAEQTVQVPLEGWVNISRFEDFVSGALPGVPTQQASKVLQEAVRQTFKELKLEVVPRNWLSVVALKA